MPGGLIILVRRRSMRDWEPVCDGADLLALLTEKFEWVNDLLLLCNNRKESMKPVV